MSSHVPDAQPGTPLSIVLARVAGELCELTVVTRRLEDVTGQIAGLADPEHFATLQELDRVNQTIVELATFVAELSTLKEADQVAVPEGLARGLLLSRLS